MILLTPDFHKIIDKAKEALSQQRFGAQRRSSEMEQNQKSYEQNLQEAMRDNIHYGHSQSMADFAAAHHRMMSQRVMRQDQKRHSAIGESLASAELQLEKLSESVSDLLAQLDPVMRPETPKVQTASGGFNSERGVGESCLILDQIEGHAGRISAITARLVEARARLCI